MRVLLTGSSGWLGRFLAPRLVSAGHAVTGLDIAPGVHTDVLGSMGDAGLIDRLFTKGGFEAVVHAGALHKPDIVRYPASAFVEVNVAGTLHLLEAAVRHRASRFVFTSTTSLMITRAIREEAGEAAAWLDEASGPLAPRNIYGVTKRAAEELCRLYHDLHGLPVIVLRTARFFPEDDDTLAVPSGDNLKANEFLNRRLTVEDCTAAHLAALDGAERLGWGVYVVSAPPPFTRADAARLKTDAAGLIAERFPDAPALYAKRGWVLPESIGRVYDPSVIERDLGFRCRTDFAAVLKALEEDGPLPFTHDPGYVPPKELGR
jgi:nucleoside-diphosphate-sugar epimerase